MPKNKTPPSPHNSPPPTHMRRLTLVARAASRSFAASSLPPRPPRRGPARPTDPTPPPAAMQSVARVYAHVNEQQPREYWDYEAVTVEWG